MWINRRRTLVAGLLALSGAMLANTATAQDDWSKVVAAAKAEGKLIILDSAKLDAIKTKSMVQALKAMGAESALIIDGANPDENFVRSVRNIKHVDMLPEQGANVYDIVRRDVLVLTKNAVEQLGARLANKDGDK